MIGRIVGILIIAAAALHGYFFFAFGTFDPCTAATFKVINKEKSAVGRDVGLLFSGPLEQRIRSKGIVNCYRIAITGEAADILQ